MALLAVVLGIPGALGKTLASPGSWAADGPFLCLLVPPASGRVFHQRRHSGPHPGRLIWPCLPSNNPAVSTVPGPSVRGEGHQESFSFQVQVRLPQSHCCSALAFGDGLSHTPVHHLPEELAEHV